MVSLARKSLEKHIWLGDLSPYLLVLVPTTVLNNSVVVLRFQNKTSS